MIISHLHRFIFVKTKKTAGTSLEIALAEHCGPADIITPISPKDELLRSGPGQRSAQNYVETSYLKYTPRDWARLAVRRTKKPRYHNHIGAATIRARIGPAIWDSYYKFCFERNPWDKVVSFYYWKYRNGPRPPLSEFINSDELEKLSEAGGFGLYSIDGQLAVDDVFRYEELDAALAQISQRIGVENLAMPHAKGDTRQKSGPADPLSPDDVERIRAVFSREIDLLGYTYSGGAR